MGILDKLIKKIKVDLKAAGEERKEERELFNKTLKQEKEKAKAKKKKARQKEIIAKAKERANSSPFDFKI